MTLNDSEVFPAGTVTEDLRLIGGAPADPSHLRSTIWPPDFAGLDTVTSKL